MAQYDGYIIPSAIKHIPIAGRDLTTFVQQVRVTRTPCRAVCGSPAPGFVLDAIGRRRLRVL